jgi:Glycosyltransferase family 10 (fucosyltransferase) C-term
MRKNFQRLKDSQALVPCRMDEDCQPTWNTVGLFSWWNAATSAPKVLLHNTLPFHRNICGKVIWGGGGTLELDGLEIARCLSSGLPYVNSPRPPTVSGQGLKPIELFWSSSDRPYMDDYGGNKHFELEDFPCPVACRKAGYFSILSLILIKDTNLEIMSTMEGEQYYPEVKVKRKSYRHNQFYATTSFQSEIPLPYFSWAEYAIQHPAVDFDKVIKGASFIANNCDSANKREEIVLALMATQLRVDSLSGCHNNAKPPAGVDMDNKAAVQGQYLFHLAFENQNTDDYITEKLWGALASGTLPVYLGAPNVKDHVPPNSIIVVDDFPSTQELATYLIRLTKDKALYESYHAWRSKPIDAMFQKKFEFTHTHSTCRICKWAHSMKHGFRWDHGSQEVVNPSIPHKTCRNKLGLVGHPFKEYWSMASGETPVSVHSDSSTKTCSWDSSNRILDIDEGAFQRKVYDQDGITDLVIERIRQGTSSYELTLETSIASSDLKSIDDDVGREWRLQDGDSRITVLFSPSVVPRLVRPGTLQVDISSSLRLRVIVEDLDVFHKGATKHPSYFGSVMKRDFFTPIEAYKVLQSNI